MNTKANHPFYSILLQSYYIFANYASFCGKKNWGTYLSRNDAEIMKQQ